MPTTFNPARLFEEASGVLPLIAVPFNAIVGNNQAVYAAVAGKRIRVMGWIAQSSTAAAADWQLKSASGGTAITGFNWAPANTLASDKLPVFESGYCETDTDDGLYLDVGTSAAYFTFFVVVYTPGAA